MKKSLSLSLSAVFLSASLTMQSAWSNEKPNPKLKASALEKAAHFSQFSKGLQNIKSRLDIIKKRRKFEVKRKDEGVKMKLIARDLPKIKWTKNETPNPRKSRSLENKTSRFKDIIRYSKK